MTFAQSLGRETVASLLSREAIRYVNNTRFVIVWNPVPTALLRARDRRNVSERLLLVFIALDRCFTGFRSALRQPSLCTDDPLGMCDCVYGVCVRVRYFYI